MREGHASRTAEQNALFRAMECALPETERLFNEPLARSFLTWPYSLVANLARLPGLRRLLPWFIDYRWPGVRTSVVARTRLIDELIDGSMQGEISQVVILGAGFDSRAYRVPALSKATVFEVDHPDTQAAKRRAIQRAVGAPPNNVRYIASDFTQQDLESKMASAGYRTTLPTLILWEGVTNYLTEKAFDATLHWCSSAASGSLLVFTYVHIDILTHPEKFVGTDRLFAALDKSGERFTFGIDPERLPDILSRHGMSLESDVGAAEYRARFYGKAARTMVGHEFYRVAVSRVGRGSPTDT